MFANYKTPECFFVFYIFLLLRVCGLSYFTLFVITDMTLKCAKKVWKKIKRKTNNYYLLLSEN